MESATACILDRTNEMFSFAQEVNRRPNREQKRISSRNTPCHCDTRTELVELSQCVQFIVLFDMRQ
jgi:hypothetical protein